MYIFFKNDIVNCPVKVHVHFFTLFCGNVAKNECQQAISCAKSLVPVIEETVLTKKLEKTLIGAPKTCYWLKRIGTEALC